MAHTQPVLADAEGDDAEPEDAHSSADGSEGAGDELAADTLFGLGETFDDALQALLGPTIGGGSEFHHRINLFVKCPSTPPPSAPTCR